MGSYWDANSMTVSDGLVKRSKGVEGGLKITSEISFMK